MKKLVVLSFALLFGLISMPAMADGIKVEEAWVRAAPPSVKVLAAYMTIKNDGDTGKTIIGAHSPQFAKVEFHESLNLNGMATMIARDSLVIGAGSEVALKPGGYHMMLIGSQRMIHPGDKISLTLLFSDRTSHEVIANVRKGHGKAMDHSRMNHNMMGQHQGKMNHNMMGQHQGMMNHNMMGQSGHCTCMKNGMCKHGNKDGSCGCKKDGSCACMKGGMCKHGYKNGSCACMKNAMMKSKHDDDDDDHDDSDKDDDYKDGDHEKEEHENIDHH
ncbi:MAG: copper chaperone PCu(A)C [Magnetococcales bacterium]|nr:copper chaperone PCu(A)C [Magnetococcales bacterium]